MTLVPYFSKIPLHVVNVPLMNPKCSPCISQVLDPKKQLKKPAVKQPAGLKEMIRGGAVAMLGPSPV